MSYRWANADNTGVIREADGAFIPASQSNRDYCDLVANNVAIAPYSRFATVEQAKSGRLADLAHRRWLAEQAFTFGGSPLTLDDGTQRRIGGALQYLELSGETSVRWQVARGMFTTLTAQQLTALAIAAGAHVQACFANVEVIGLEIEAAQTIEAVEAVDIDQGWP